ncbi:dephospho-CoA kinase [Ischnura elegans]|uniref:dephospho-CoA kinase n=1 Tax=Ischnura elegans TaxID=197161 RepID=UPI001ED88B61|nr:dephospho-CoA kinase [Ischnura elegans]
MFIVGLTGGIATGKSLVTSILRENGVSVIDADTIARKVVEPGQSAWSKIRKEFGDGVFYSNGELNREALGNIVFQDVDKRKKLNQITHPEIYKEMLFAATKCFFSGEKFIVMDLPLLYETGAMLKYLHKVIVVDCEKECQLARLMARGQGMSESAALQRINAQMPLEEKCERANFVINNSGSEEETRQQVEGILSVLQKSRAYWRLRLLFLGVIVSILFILRALIW